MTSPVATGSSRFRHICFRGDVNLRRLSNVRFDLSTRNCDLISESSLSEHLLSLKVCIGAKEFFSLALKRSIIKS